MCPSEDRCLECDWELQQRQSASVCCLCGCSFTTAFDYLLLLECEIWICFFITQSLACVGTGRRMGNSRVIFSDMLVWICVLSCAIAEFWIVALYLVGRKEIFKINIIVMFAIGFQSYYRDGNYLVFGLYYNISASMWWIAMKFYTFVVLRG